MNDEVVTQDDFLKAFGIGSADQADEQNNGSQQGSDESTDGATGESQDQGQTQDQQGDTDAGSEGNQDQQTNTNPTDKSAKAFAAMRVELAQKQKLLDDVATVLGLDPKAKDSMDQLQSKLTESLAKKQGIPAETLARLNKLEEMEQQRNEEQVRNNAYLGFQKVKTQFKLSDQELQQFASELVADGKNPFVQSFDLVAEYKLKNFDKLLEDAKQQGIQAEIARASKANDNASTPSNKQGGAQDQSTDQITTVKQLTDWFNKQQ